MSVQPIFLDMKTINNFAETVAEKLKFYAGGDLNFIVEKLGGNVHYLNIDDWFKNGDGKIKVKDKKFDIFVSNFFGPYRTRFTIAHELGHYFLHSLAGAKDIEKERLGSDRLETEANWFAAGFLMPKKIFLEHKKICDDVGYLAGIFNVSNSAVNYRIKNLERLKRE